MMDTTQLFYKGITGHDLLTADEERELAICAREGDTSARDYFIMHNTRLVISIARRYQGNGVDLQDLIQAGTVGLMTAIEKYEPERGRFSTCATLWIRQAMMREIAKNGRNIRLPDHMNVLVARIRRVRAEIEARNGAATPTGIAKELGMDEERVSGALRYDRQSATLSLDVVLGNQDDDDVEFGYFVADTDAPDPEEEAAAAELRGAIAEAIATLTAREAQILRMRFGLDGGAMKTLEQCGQKFGLTRERARQIEKRALGKLRASTLREFAEL